ncbi:AAA family ATPase [Rhodococcoides yunnanense]|uniref:AAA family ATPase n=1 Tax=Rhodococcoides yunnanense TaxID=278209 RepID=UPI000933A77C|nr:AAA family ATPase [Rhodococcus yunnanensis]
MAVGNRAGELVGREELAGVLAGMVRRPDADRRMLWLLGEAGIGKSTLLRYARTEAVDAGARVLSASGVDAETHQIFSGLQQLLWPVLSVVDSLPPQLRRPLDEVLGRVAPSPAVDTLACRHAVLHVLETLASERALVLLLDDAHLLDRDSLDIVTYALRRVNGPMTTLCSARGHRVPDGVDPGVPAVEVPSLSAAEAAALMDRGPAVSSHAARLEIIHQAEGNPLAIVEFSRAVAKSGPGMLVGAGVDRIRRVQSLFSVRLAALSAEPRRLLLYAASGSGYESVDTITAAAGFGADLSVWSEAERSGLVTVDGRRVQFVHPLARAAAYSDCTVDERRSAHVDFARTLSFDPPCRAWHRAAAADGPDESVAAELENAAELSQRRGGYFEVARALERAAESSPGELDAARRYARAAHAAYMAGDPQWGLALAASVRRITSDPEIRSLAALPTATILLQIARPEESFDIVYRTLVESMPADDSLPLAMLATAVGAAHYSGGESARARLAQMLDLIPQPRAVDDEFLTPMPDAAKASVRRMISDYIAGSARPSSAERRPRRAPALSIDAKISWEFAEGTTATLTDNSADAAALFSSGIESLKEIGSVGAGAIPMASLVGALIDTGRWDEVDAAADAASDVAAVGRMTLVDSIVETNRAIIEAHRGNFDAANGHAARAGSLFEPRGNPALAVDLDRTLAFIACARGDFGSGYDRLTTLFDADGTPVHRLVSVRAIADLAWAGTRSGQHVAARRAVTAIGRAIGSAPPVRIRLLRHLAAALVSDTTRSAERHYRLAVFDPAGEQWPVERARARLHYGEWLRRNRRPADARPLLAAAFETFERVGSVVFADIARAELRAAGGSRGTSPIADSDAWGSLTAQEQHIAALAADGLTNRQIGEQLHLSPRTIGSHLYHLYPKLGVSKRHELRGVIESAPPPARISAPH